MKLRTFRAIAIASALPGALLLNGCSKSPESHPAAEDGIASMMEFKTVKTSETSKSTFPQLMDQWRRQGWAVLSTSKVVTNADGTMHRTVKLAKSK